MRATITRVRRFDFEFLSPIEISESGKRLIIQGTLLSRGVSKNNVDYNEGILDSVSKMGEGQPMFYGTETRVDPNTGRLTRNMHRRRDIIGHVIKTWLSPDGLKVFFKALIENAEIAESLKKTKGWGVSIGGKGFGKQVIDAAGRMFTTLSSFILNHVQLLAPNVPKGIEDATVDSVYEESLKIYGGLTVNELSAIVLALRLRQKQKENEE